MWLPAAAAALLTYVLAKLGHHGTHAGTHFTDAGTLGVDAGVGLDGPDRQLVDVARPLEVRRRAPDVGDAGAQLPRQVAVERLDHRLEVVRRRSDYRRRRRSERLHLVDGLLVAGEEPPRRDVRRLTRTAGWKSEVGRQIDVLIARAVPKVKKAAPFEVKFPLFIRLFRI